jgi:hypothetical protein
VSNFATAVKNEARDWGHVAWHTLMLLWHLARAIAIFAGIVAMILGVIGYVWWRSVERQTEQDRIDGELTRLRNRIERVERATASGPR